MLTPTDPLDAAALATALATGKRHYHRHRLLIDWSRDGLYNHALSDVTPAVAASGGVSLTLDLTNDTPGAGVTASGASFPQLSARFDGHLTVAGRPVLLAELLAPYNSSSPLYGVRIGGTPVRWYVSTRTSRGWIEQKQFTGVLDERRCEIGAATVRLIALSSISNALSGPASWPGWAVDGTASARIGDSTPQVGYTSAVVDMMCNQGGLRTRPRAPWEYNSAVIAVVSIPLCGSFASTVGRMRSKYPWGNATLFPESYTISPGSRIDFDYWASGAVHGVCRNAAPSVYPGSLHYTGRDTQPVWTGRSTSVTAWVYCGPDATGYDASPGSALRPTIASYYFGYSLFSGNNYAHRLTLASNGKVLQIQVEAGTDRHYRVDYTPGTNAWRHVHVQLDHSAGAVRAKMFVDGVEQVNFVPTGAGNSQVATAINVLFPPLLGARLQPAVLCSDVMVWQETGAPVVVPERTFTPGAVVDLGTNAFSYMPAPYGAQRDVIKDVTAAEYAVIRPDPDGVLHWLTRTNARGDGAPVFTLTLSSAAEVATVDTATSKANTAVCSASYGEATWKTAWELGTVDQIPAPVGTTTYVFPTDRNVVSIETGTYPRLYQSATTASSVPVWNSSVVAGYIFVYDGGETEELSNQTMVATANQAGLNDDFYIRLVITNTGAGTGRFRFKSDSTAGTDPRPALRIAGLVRVVRDADTLTESFAENVTSDGQVIPIAVGGGVWNQYISITQLTARFVLRRATQDIPVFDRITAPGDPRLEITDAGVLELGVSGPRVRVYLAGIVRTFDGSGLSDNYLVQVTHAPGKCALGDAVHGRLGFTAVLG